MVYEWKVRWIELWRLQGIVRHTAPVHTPITTHSRGREREES